jgi:uncharacterized protein YjbK
MSDEAEAEERKTIPKSEYTYLITDFSINQSQSQSQANHQQFA